MRIILLLLIIVLLLGTQSCALKARKPVLKQKIAPKYQSLAERQLKCFKALLLMDVNPTDALLACTTFHKTR
jgi:hypothetical protein